MKWIMQGDAKQHHDDPIFTWTPTVIPADVPLEWQCRMTTRIIEIPWLIDLEYLLEACFGNTDPHIAEWRDA
jgi:hypothetical protein